MDLERHDEMVMARHVGGKFSLLERQFCSFFDFFARKNARNALTRHKSRFDHHRSIRSSFHHRHPSCPQKSYSSCWRCPQCIAANDPPSNRPNSRSSPRSPRTPLPALQGVHRLSLDPPPLPLLRKATSAMQRAGIDAIQRIRSRLHPQPLQR